MYNILTRLCAELEGGHGRWRLIDVYKVTIRSTAMQEVLQLAARQGQGTSNAYNVAHCYYVQGWATALCDVMRYTYMGGWDRACKAP